MKISRRDFIKACGASAALASVGATMAPPQFTPTALAAPVYPREPRMHEPFLHPFPPPRTKSASWKARAFRMAETTARPTMPC